MRGTCILVSKWEKRHPSPLKLKWYNGFVILGNMTISGKKLGKGDAVVRQRELVRAINGEFERAGKKHHWLHDRFLDLYQKKQLANFRIFDINWFKGAGDIMEYVSLLHDAQTPMEDFLAMAELMSIGVDEKITKKELAAQVKARKDWRVYARKVEMWKQEQERFREWSDLYEFLRERGYVTALLPVEYDDGRWTLECLEDGVEVTLQLTAWTDGLDVQVIRENRLEYVGSIDWDEEEKGDTPDLLLL